jgi:hypothetical protein
MPKTQAESPKKAAAAAKAEAPKNPAKKAAAAAVGVDAQTEVLAPKPEEKAKPEAKAKKAAAAKIIPLPESTEELLAHPEIKVSGAGSFEGKLPVEIGKLLIAGVAAEGVYDGALDVKSILENYVDGGKIEALKINAGKSLTWLKFYAGDTEVGYLFDGTKLSGMVSDGFISQ